MLLNESEEFMSSEAFGIMDLSSAIVTVLFRLSVLFYLFIFRERRRKGESEGEKH